MARPKKEEVQGRKPVKFISTFTDSFVFLMNEFDEAGNKLFHTDANGNSKVPNIKEFKFVKVPPHKDKHGNWDKTTGFQFFIVDPAIYGDVEYDRILAYLNKLKEDKRYKLYTEDEYFQYRNPEAHRISQKLAEKDAVIADKDAKIKELESRLGL